MNKLLSIITVTYNCEDIVEKTIDSVKKQDFYDYEYIFIDGDSNDRTVEKIKNHVKYLTNSYIIISEPDQGIYDAMNKGIKKANGEYILFLNAGDCLKENVLNDAFKNLSEKNNLPILYGNSTNVYINSKSEELRIKITAPKSVSEFEGLNKGMCGLRHQAMIIPRRVFSSIGLYDLSFPISSDWDHMISCIENNISFKYIDIDFCDYRMDGISTKPNLVERHKIREKHNMYEIIDIQFLKEVFSPQCLCRLFLGQKIYNNLLFKYHKKVRFNE